MIRITYKGELLDTDPEQQFFVNYQAADLSNLGTRSSAYSDTWVLPATVHNRLVFGMIDSPTGNVAAAYGNEECRVYNDNYLLLVGIGRVVDTDTNVIRLEVTGGIIYTLNQIGSTTVSSVNQDEVIGVWNANNVAVGLTTGTGLVRYGFFNDGGLTKIDTVVTNQIDLFYFKPWFSVTKIIERTLNYNGYNVEFPKLQDLESFVISGSNYHYNLNFTQIGFTAQTASFYQFPNTIVKLPFNNITGNSTGWNDYTREFTCPVNGYVQVEFMCEMDMPLSRDQVISIINSNGLVYYQYIIPAGTDSSTILKPFSFSIFMQSGERLYIESSVDSSTGSGCIFSNLSLTIKAIDLIAYNAPLSGRSLPDVTLDSLIVDICNRYSLIVSSNNDTVVFASIDELKTKQPTDWTGKVGSDDKSISQKQYRSEFVYGSLAKQNTFNNANDNSEQGIIISNTFTGEVSNQAYASKFYLGVENQPAFISDDFVGGLMNISIYESLKFSKPIYQYSTAINRLAAGNYIFYRGQFWQAYVPIFPLDPNRPLPPTANGGNKWVPANHKDLFTISRNVVVGNMENTWSAPIRPQWYDATESEYGVRIVNPSVSALKTTGYQITFGKQEWPYLISQYSQTLQSILLNPRVDKMLVKLNVADVSNIDFTKPVAINSVQYYINIINQFDPTQQGLVLCELVQIPLE